MPEAFAERLDEVRRRDHTYSVFGANTHLYWNRPVSPADLAQLEVDSGVPLPPEYATFMQDVGYGAGPYYGLWSPRVSLAEIRALGHEYEQKTGTPISPALPFPFRASTLRDIDARAAAGARPAVAEQDWPCSGCLPICDQGCTFSSVLVLNGDFAGHVWDLACFSGFSGEWMPAQRPPGTLHGRVVLEPLPRPPTFAEWFVGWLEQCEADLSTAVEAKPLPSPRQAARLPHNPTSQWTGAADERTWLQRLFGRGPGR